MTDLPSRHPNGEAYTWLPLLVFLPLSIMEAFLLIFEPGGALGSPQFWLAAVMMILSTVAWLVVLLVAVSRRMWRWALSTLLAGFVSIAAMGLCIAFEEQIHFQIMRPIYLHEIAQSNAARMEWPWRGGLGFDEVLVFDRSAAGQLAIGGTSERRIDSCVYETRRMSRDFYLDTARC
jgi:hypothetical protein